MYFGILTSPARDGNGSKTLDPSELREHEVMSTLLECRNAWKKVEHLQAPEPVKSAEALPSLPEDDVMDISDDGAVLPKERKESRKAKKAKAKAVKKAKAIEDSLADLDSLLTSKKVTKQKAESKDDEEDSNSDFGEEEYLDSKAAADKAARKKSLKFYTAQIAQKANRRAAGGRDAGGDMDIPYRERLRDRQARLNAEAENRGKKGANIGADLGEGSDGEEDHEVVKAIRDEGNDEYYDMIAAASNKRKSEKSARAAAIAEAGSADRIVEVAQVGPDGRREITYAIKANKGLAPKRKKEVRNPRGMCFYIMLNLYPNPNSLTNTNPMNSQEKASIREQAQKAQESKGCVLWRTRKGWLCWREEWSKDKPCQICQAHVNLAISRHYSMAIVHINRTHVDENNPHLINM